MTITRKRVKTTISLRPTLISNWPLIDAVSRCEELGISASLLVTTLAQIGLQQVEIMQEGTREEIEARLSELITRQTSLPPSLRSRSHKAVSAPISDAGRRKQVSEEPPAAPQDPAGTARDHVSTITMPKPDAASSQMVRDLFGR